MRTYIFLFLILVSFQCNVDQRDDEVARWKKQASRVTIMRDGYGVPHIYGQTDADAVFGLLYAQCEDDFKRVERNYVIAIGRLAEVKGEESIYSDVRANMYMTKEEAIAYYNECPEWLQKLCQAFADGINYYLHVHPEVEPELITRFEPWMPMYFTEGSIGGDIESISTRRIKAFYENTIAEKEEAYEKSQGSNGFAISGKLTESGNPMLLINPHTTFYFRGEVHVVSEEGLNAYGAVTWGQFFVYQGFNEKNGWMHTSSRTDVMDYFIETIETKDGGRFYKYGDELRPISEKEVILSYKSGDTLSEKSFTIYRTHHGPITQELDGKWVSTAMMWSPVKALTQSYTRTKTSNYDEFLEMMQIRTNSSNNTVYADADGNIAYFQGNFVPKRNAEFDYSKPVDGSNPATDWQGLHEVSECIKLLNPGNGWIQNCNSTPFTAAGEFSPKKEEYPYYMATEPENFRGVHAIRVLTGIDSLTLDKLITVAYDPYLPAFQKLIPGLIEAFDKAGKGFDKLKPAIEELRNWNLTVSKESVAMSLAVYYYNVYSRNGARPEGMSDIERINYFGTATDYKERLNFFDQGVTMLTEDFGSWKTPWGEINRLQRLDGEIDQHFDDNKPSLPVGMAAGRLGALASFTPRGSEENKRLYGNHGNSFVAVVEFGEKVRAKSILAGGQSGDPKSPHFFDQAELYANGKFKDVSYYREDVEKNAKRTYHPGE